MFRTPAVFLSLLTMLVAGCAGTGVRQVPPGQVGMEVDIQQLAEDADAYDVYASTDRAVTTALIFDPKEDPYEVVVQGKLWQTVKDKRELQARIEEMRWAYNFSNQVKAITAPNAPDQAAALVYSPNPVRASTAGPESVEIDPLYMEDACRGTYQFGSGPCFEVRESGF
ncbi:MAG: hypothetical protein ACLFTB_01050 [Desulfovibrionales bacterium]